MQQQEEFNTMQNNSGEKRLKHIKGSTYQKFKPAFKFSTSNIVF